MAHTDVKTLFGERVPNYAKRKDGHKRNSPLAQLDRSYIGCIERGERNVSIENICKIASTLLVSPAVLFDWWGGR